VLCDGYGPLGAVAGDVAMLQQGDAISYVSRLSASALSAPSQLASRRPALQAVATEAAEFATLALAASAAVDSLNRIWRKT